MPAKRGPKSGATAAAAVAAVLRLLLFAQVIQLPSATLAEAVGIATVEHGYNNQQYQRPAATTKPVSCRRFRSSP